MRLRTLLFVFITLISPAFVWAQEKGPSIPKIDLAIKLGANIAKLSGDTWDNGYKAGFLGGVAVGLREHRIGVQVEAFFSQTSYTVSGHNFYDAYSGFYNNLADSTKNGSFKVTYLSIPVLFQLKLIPLLWLQVGPQYSGVVSVKDADNLVHDAKGLFKSGDLSGVIGLELKLPLHLNIGARYILGLSSLNNTDVSGAWQQRTVQVHVAYAFL
ncbi:MAG: porin family protein [Flavipsychrobacter sp.]